jgi:hypothetical protein
VTDTPVVPRYGEGALADVLPSLLAALGVPGEPNPLGLAPLRAACLLLVDGLGWRLLREHAEHAPFLTSLADGAEPITAGFPATTATSVTAIGTGSPAGEHGIVGYTFRTPDGDLLDVLGWSTHGQGKRVDMRERFVPEDAQPAPTALERAAADGVRVRLAVPHQFRGSGLTRAALRGGETSGVFALGDLAVAASAALDSTGRTLCYAYHGDVDLLGHAYGPGSLAWRLQLEHVDRLAGTIAAALPPDAALVVVADHGMVTVPESDRVDFDQEPALAEGVRLLGGEVRVRHVYAESGAADDVLATWRGVLGDRAWVLTREEVIAAGWFGPEVTDRARERIGDVVVACRGRTGIVRSGVEPILSRMPGQHGSLTEEEQLVPLLVHRSRA